MPLLPSAKPTTHNPEASALLPADVRHELDRLKFEVKRVQPGGRRAERNSRQRGAGIEFIDYRGYVPGDDFRALDWHAYMKHNKLVLKLYEEQQDLPVYILLDASQSMRHEVSGESSVVSGEHRGATTHHSPLTTRKFLFARQLAAAFCYIGLASEDRVSIFPFAEAPLPGMRPLAGRNVVNRMLDYLQRLAGGQRTNLLHALERFIGRQERRGVVVLISDFFAQDDLHAALGALKRLRHDVAVVLLHDDSEAQSLPDGDLLLEDCETGETVAVTLTPQTRELYAQAYRQFTTDLETFCRRNSVFFFRAGLTDSVARIVADVVRQQGVRGWARNLQ